MSGSKSSVKTTTSSKMTPTRFEWLSADSFVVLREGVVSVECLGPSSKRARLLTEGRSVDGFGVSADRKWLATHHSSFLSVGRLAGGRRASVDLRGRVEEVRWHPLASGCLVALTRHALHVVTVSSGPRLHSDELALSRPLSSFSFASAPPTGVASAVDCLTGEERGSAPQGSEHAVVRAWAQFCVYGVRPSGEVVAVCPVVPHGFVLSDLEYSSLWLVAQSRLSADSAEWALVERWLAECWKECHSEGVFVYDHSCALAVSGSTLVPSTECVLSSPKDEPPCESAHCVSVCALDPSCVRSGEEQWVETPVVVRAWSDRTVDVVCVADHPVPSWACDSHEMECAEWPSVVRERVLSEGGGPVGRLVQDGDAVVVCDSQGGTVVYLHWLGHSVSEEQCVCHSHCVTLHPSLSDWLLSPKGDLFVLDGVGAIHQVRPLSPLPVGGAVPPSLDIVPLHSLLPDVRSSLSQLVSLSSSCPCPSLSSADSLRLFHSQIRDPALRVVAQLKQGYAVVFAREDWLVHLAEQVLPALCARLDEGVARAQEHAGRLRKTQEELARADLLLRAQWEAERQRSGQAESGREVAMREWLAGVEEECSLVGSSLRSISSRDLLLRRVERLSLATGHSTSATLSRMAAPLHCLRADLSRLDHSLSSMAGSLRLVHSKLDHTQCSLVARL